MEYFILDFTIIAKLIIAWMLMTLLVLTNCYYVLLTNLCFISSVNLFIIHNYKFELHILMHLFRFILVISSLKLDHQDVIIVISLSLFINYQLDFVIINLFSHYLKN